MVSPNRFLQEKQRQLTTARMVDAVMEVVDEIQYAAKPKKTFDFRRYFCFLIKKTGWMVLCGLVCALLALAFFHFFPPEYEATAKLYLLENDGTGVQLTSLQTGTLLVPDYQEVLKTWEVHEAVRSQLHLDMTYRQMQNMLTVHVPTGSRLLYITVRHSDPEFAAELANAYAQAAYAFISEELNGLETELFSSAIIPGRPSGVGIFLRLMIAFAAGSLLCAGILTVFFCLDRRIHTPQDLTAATDIPVLAAFSSHKEPMKAEDQRNTARLLASKLLRRHAQCILISAPHRHAGVSFICRELLHAMSSINQKTLLIKVQTCCPAAADPVSGCLGWKKQIQFSDSGDFLLLSGTAEELAAHLFHPKTAEMMKELKKMYDMLLIDTPPLTTCTEGTAFLPFCDYLLLVAAHGHTLVPDAAAYAAELQTAALPLGAVFNGTAASAKKRSFVSWQKAGAEI